MDKYLCAEDDDPDYRYWKRMKEFEDAARLREIMIDAVRDGKTETPHPA